MDDAEITSVQADCSRTTLFMANTNDGNACGSLHGIPLGIHIHLVNNN